MKELINKLEILKLVSPELSDWGEGYTSGVMDALQIVRAHNPWHEVTELPPVYEQSPDRSIEVLVLTADGNIYTGVYDYKQKAFCILNRRSIAKEIGWTYLPEGKP